MIRVSKFTRNVTYFLSFELEKIGREWLHKQSQQN